MSYMIGKIGVIAMKMSFGDSSKKQMLTKQRMTDSVEKTV